MSMYSSNLVLEVAPSVLLGLGLYQVLAKQRRLLMNPLMPCTQLPVVQTAVVYQNVTVGKAAAAVPTSC